MPGGPVRFTLDDGETFSVEQEDLRRVHDALHRLMPESGAVSMVALVTGVMVEPDLFGAPIDLTAEQSAFFRSALAHVHPEVKAARRLPSDR